MEAKSTELSPLLDSCAADLGCTFDASDSPCEHDMDDKNRSSTSTSASNSNSRFGRSAFRSWPSHSPSSPVLMQDYANRPLPRLPSSACSLPGSSAAVEHQSQGQMVELSAGKEAKSEHRSSAFSTSSMPSMQQYRRHDDDDSDADASILSTASPAPRSSYKPPVRCSRRSSQKVHQLIGLQVDVMDNQMLPMANVSPVSPFTRPDLKTADYGVPDCSVVPVLVADDGDTSSRGSSWGPMSPETDAIPAPLNIRKSSGDGNYKRMGRLSEYLLQMDLEDDDDQVHDHDHDEDAVLPWESAHGQFSHVGAAGEYHRFTADLATRHSRDSRQLSGDGSVFPSTASSKKKRSSFGLTFSAATLFSRRRERSDSVVCPPSSVVPEKARLALPKPPRQSPADFVAGPAYPSLSGFASPRLPTDVAPPRPPPAPPLRSAWDSDSDSDDPPAMSSLKDWFAHRTTDETKAQRRTSSVSRPKPDRQFQMPRPGEGRELTARRQEREKQIKLEKAAKRREARQSDSKKTFAMIPKEFGFSSSRFTGL
ncbi:hypothetical protein E4U42_004072 [Claviceps africana]|uniref:Uncharacterized protein n=1 Tax=Claviceps africana TaxID=83212 RepID=A0A8K0JC65_9HYPO|nr:hypothetical protein E4U42_004072 [Claviceps africana]